MDSTLALWRPDDRAAGGESLREFQTRVEKALLQLLLHHSPSGRVILVVHSGVIDAALRWAFGLGPDTLWLAEAAVGHASITQLHHFPQGRHAAGALRHTVLVRVGDVSHLSAALVTGL